MKTNSVNTAREVDKLVEAFARDKKNAHFEDVVLLMIYLLEKSEATSLKDAYLKSCAIMRIDVAEVVK